MAEYIYQSKEAMHMKIIQALYASFAESREDAQSLKLCQTHASSVILTSHFAYKLKKPKNFDFFDYSTPQERRHFCIQEVILNTPFAPEIYQGVAPVLLLENRNIRLGPPLPPEQVPQPESLFAGGIVIDYAVVMKRLRDDATLEAWIQSGRADETLLSAIARFVANFHAESNFSNSISEFGKIDIIQQNWEENFVQMKPYIGRTLDQQTYDTITTYVRQFLQCRHTLFNQRIQNHAIRDCHGDLRLQHIYILDGKQPNFALLDRIEFNERFRYGDIAAEVAFLTMELDASGRHDLAMHFLHEYATACHDEQIYELIPFYQCYRACVRGKVLSFQLDEEEVSENQRQKVAEQATELFSLANFYAQYPVRPMVILVGGLMGTGKSTLVRALQSHYHWPSFSSDTARKQLALLDPQQPQADAFEQGIYTPQWSKRTYDALGASAANLLAQGCSVLLDASFSRRTDRAVLAQIAKDHQATLIFLECRCPSRIALERLTQRWKKRQRKEGNTPTEASDGRPDLYAIQADAWESFSPVHEARTKHRIINTNQPIKYALEETLQALDIPHLLCFLEKYL